MGVYGGIAAGLIAASGFGVADFMAQGLARRYGWLRTMLWLQMASLPVLSAIAFFVTGPSALTGESGAWISLLLYGVSNTIGTFGLYRAFQVGTVSVVSPIASAFGAATVLVALLAGYPPHASLWPGLILTVLGISVTSMVREQGQGGPRFRRSLGVGWALLSALAFGVSFYGLAPMSEAMGPFWPVAGFRLTSLLMVFMCLRWASRNSAVRSFAALDQGSGLWNSGDSLRLSALVVLDSGSMVIYSLGTSSAHVGVVAVLASLFSAVTVLLAQIVLKERLAWWQWCGILAIFVGVAWVSYFSA